MKHKHNTNIPPCARARLGNVEANIFVQFSQFCKMFLALRGPQNVLPKWGEVPRALGGPGGGANDGKAWESKRKHGKAPVGPSSAFPATRTRSPICSNIFKNLCKNIERGLTIAGAKLSKNFPKPAAGSFLPLPPDRSDPHGTNCKMLKTIAKTVFYSCRTATIKHVKTIRKTRKCKNAD